MLNIKKIKIGHLDYEVKYMEDWQADLGGACGWCNNISQVIGVRASLSKDRVKEVLIHEIMHALNDIMEVNTEEEMCSRLGVGLAMVLRDNPKIRKFLMT